MTRPYILGIDPGKHGALTLLRADKAIIRAFSIPLLQEARASTRAVVIHDSNGDVFNISKPRPSVRAEIDEETLAADFKRTVEETWPDKPLALIEKVGGIHGQSASASFTFGRVTGLLIGLCRAHGCDVLEVPAAEWKGFLRVPADKAGAVTRATEMFGQAAADRYWRRKKDDGVAEAAMIAAYGIMKGL